MLTEQNLSIDTYPEEAILTGIIFLHVKTVTRRSETQTSSGD